ncbi:MAG: hypothetical protein WD794_11830, partial [Mycobacteriales bacterium]
MEHLAADALLVIRTAALTAFGALALVAAARAPRSGAGGWWAAGAFAALSVVLLQSLLVSDDAELPVLLRAVPVLLLLAFPYLLLRFTGSFRRLPHWLEVPAGLAAAAALLATVLLPPLPEERPLPTWAVVYVAAVLAYWVFVSSVTVVRRWGAGRGRHIQQAAHLGQQRIRRLAREQGSWAQLGGQGEDVGHQVGRGL